MYLSHTFHRLALEEIVRNIYQRKLLFKPGVRFYYRMVYNIVTRQTFLKFLISQKVSPMYAFRGIWWETSMWKPIQYRF